MNHLHHTQGIFPFSRFTYPKSGNQDKKSKEACYWLDKLIQVLRIHIKMVGVTASDQSQTWVSVLAAEQLILQWKINT